MPAQQYQWIRPAAARSKDSFFTNTISYSLISLDMSSILLATVSLDSGTAPSLAAALSPIIILHMSCAAGKMRVSAIVCGLPSLPILLATTYDASKHDGGHQAFF